MLQHVSLMQFGSGHNAAAGYAAAAVAATRCVLQKGDHMSSTARLLLCWLIGGRGIRLLMAIGFIACSIDAITVAVGCSGSTTSSTTSSRSSCCWRWRWRRPWLV